MLLLVIVDMFPHGEEGDRTEELVELGRLLLANWKA